MESEAGKHATYEGLETCGSAAACPVCSSRINAKRADDVRQALERWGTRHPGSTVGFLTLTMRHNKRDTLTQLWDGLAYAWGRVTSGKGWRLLKDRHGLGGYIRVIEATHGANGWHLHIHAALLFSARLTAAELETVRGEMFARWVTGLEAKGLTALDGPGADLRRSYSDSGLGRYFTKMAEELTGSHAKKAAGGGRTPFSILGDLATLDAPGGCPDALLWHEWVRVSKQRRMITWSRGLRDALEMDDELTDEEAAQDDGTEVERYTLALIHRKDWAQLVKAGATLKLLGKLEAAARDWDSSTAREVLAAWLGVDGFLWVEPDP